MRKLLLGVAAAATIGLAAVPAMAQVDVYAGPGGVGVDVGGPHYYHPYRGYYGYAGPGWGWHHGWRHHRFYHDWD